MKLPLIERLGPEKPETRCYPPGDSGRGGRPSKAWAIVAALGIFSISGLEGFALSQGINGTALTVSLSAIAGVSGASVGRLTK